MALDTSYDLKLAQNRLARDDSALATARSFLESADQKVTHLQRQIEEIRVQQVTYRDQYSKIAKRAERAKDRVYYLTQLVEVDKKLKKRRG